MVESTSFKLERYESMPLDSQASLLQRPWHDCLVDRLEEAGSDRRVKSDGNVDDLPGDGVDGRIDGSRLDLRFPCRQSNLRASANNCSKDASWMGSTP